MINLGKEYAKGLSAPACLELVGDVGAGKTTFTRGFAAGLGVKSPVTSPSFTLSNVYAFPGGRLVHYDFYRLSDPGIMSEDLIENLEDKDTITIIEWGDTISDLLPASRRRLVFSLNEDGSRSVDVEEVRP